MTSKKPGLCRRVWTAMVTTTLLALVVGCATQLAPPYDKLLAEGLNAASSETMVLMSTVSTGTRASTFASREEKYDSLIGKLDALKLASIARPMPSNKGTEIINRVLTARNVPAVQQDDDKPPSAYAIEKISGTIAKMKDTDKKQGITMAEAKAFKSQTLIYLDQAITYENFLQR